MKNKHLLVFDLNGILCDRRRSLVNDQTPSFSTKNNYVYVRPHAKEFIFWAVQQYDVAIWSSAMKYNVESLVPQLLGPRLSRRIKFIFTQEQCINIENNNQKKPVLTKPLSKIIEVYNDIGLENILMIDDSKEKMVSNPDNNYIIIESWNIEAQKDDNLLAPHSKFRNMIKKLKNFNTVTDYISRINEKERRNVV